MNKQDTANSKELCPPFYYAIGAFFISPVAALFCVLMGAIMILAWPFIPFMCYFQRKQEIEALNQTK